MAFVMCQCCEHMVESYADENLQICRDCLDALQQAEDEMRIDDLGYARNDPIHDHPELVWSR